MERGGASPTWCAADPDLTRGLIDTNALVPIGIMMKTIQDVPTIVFTAVQGGLPGSGLRARSAVRRVSGASREHEILRRGSEMTRAAVRGGPRPRRGCQVKRRAHSRSDTSRTTPIKRRKSVSSPLLFQRLTNLHTTCRLPSS